MRVGLIGTGAISNMHARAYKNIGYRIVCCTDINEQAGRKFADANGAEFVKTYQEVCRHPEVDYVDVCTFPDFRLQPLEICAETKKHILVQKPLSTNLETARKMIETAKRAGITLGTVSQHRFDDSSLFLVKALRDGRLGKILQADAYVKWFRSAEYYSRPIKGSWEVEGGGALINQAVHQVDVLLWLIGPVKEVFGYWQLGALHKIQSEDVVTAIFRYANGAQGVIQAATAFHPGYSERIEIHGTKGTAVLTGDKLTAWDVLPGDAGRSGAGGIAGEVWRFRPDGDSPGAARAAVYRFRQRDQSGQGTAGFRRSRVSLARVRAGRVSFL